MRHAMWRDASVTRNAEPQRKKNKWMSRPHQVIERGPSRTIVVQAFELCSREHVHRLDKKHPATNWPFGSAASTVSAGTHNHTCAHSPYTPSWTHGPCTTLTSDPWTTHLAVLLNLLSVAPACWWNPGLARWPATKSLLASHRLKFGCCALPLEHVG